MMVKKKVSDIDWLVKTKKKMDAKDSKKKKKVKKCPYCGKGFNNTSKVHKYQGGEVWHQSCVKKMNKKEGFDKYTR